MGETDVKLQQTLSSQTSQQPQVQQQQITRTGPYDQNAVTKQFANITFMGLYKDRPQRAMNGHLNRTKDISKSLQEFKDKLIEANEYIGYFAVQDRNEIYYT